MTCATSTPANVVGTGKPVNWTRLDLGITLSCAVLACLISLLPHLANRIHFGSWEYLGSSDDLLYVAFSKEAYFGGPSLRDPFTDASRSVPTLYSWLQFTPFARFAAAVSLPPTLLPLFWRMTGGLCLGGALYFLFRVLLLSLPSSRLWSFWSTLVCLADIGFIRGRTFLDTFPAVAGLVSGDWNPFHPDFAATYRVVSPLVDLPFLIWLAACVSVAHPRSWRWTLAGGIFLGISIALYFFNWTAALFALGLLFLIRLVRSRRDALMIAIVVLCGARLERRRSHTISVSSQVRR